MRKKTKRIIISLTKCCAERERSEYNYVNYFL